MAAGIEKGVRKVKVGGAVICSPGTSITHFSVVEPGSGPSSAAGSISDGRLLHSFGVTELKQR